MRTIKKLKDWKIRRFCGWKIERLISNLIICNLLIISFSYGIWGITQDISTRGAGNVGYTGFLTLPLYLTSQARNDAIATGSDDKFRTYGGYIQYGITDKFDVGLQGNSSVNSSIGVNLKYRAVKNLTTMVGFDYIMDEMMLAPFGILMTGSELGKNVSLYGGLKVFQWSNLRMQEIPVIKANKTGAIVYTGIHIFQKGGWRDSRLSSFPNGLYVELGYPINVDSKCITICLGLDGFLGLSFPRLQWSK
jgi:hypothetical protein